MKALLRTSAPVFLISVLVAGCSPEPAAVASRPAPTVTVAEIETEAVTLTRQLPGRATASLIAEVRPQVNGIVAERLFQEGGTVEAGQALYQLDDSLYRANANIAQATLQNAEAALALARTEAKRSSELYSSKAISAQEYDASQAKLQQAEAQAQLAAASLASAQITLDYSRITAPISGQIGRSSVTQGALVTANQSAPLATIQQLDPIYVDITQSSNELLQLRAALAQGELQAVDLPVQIILENGSPYPHPGKIAFSETTVDPGTGSYTLRVEVPNPDHLILPGMYLRGIVSVGQRENGILVPQKAVSRNFDGSTSVKLVAADGTVENRQVTLGQAVENRWIVESGLSAGDRVVVNGIQKAVPGSKVQTNAAAASEG
ncbi:efflux RND transporter periplasmic adaptor subunit [Pelagicoccus sp. SDUM812005]|uniref:efflux RND transporter periplasmic adaptor subunit n=1 Tax=Pelagicoccus sp. SDUM812005 TaxID=3041257 RepID=UPI002810858A|nr:efflux RND transporter periplasmic adaptor subunit [Pelagicoccus sp. SDUM812005]MDQ8180779.1 efflux RND transporter periplasmic adaptor subunit [Pelagicoccus sp. SDUM812005]